MTSTSEQDSAAAERYVKFDMVDPTAESGEYGSAQDPSPYVHLADPTRDLKRMQEGEQIVIPEESIRVEVNYPLRDSHVFTLKSDDPEGFQRKELALKIALLYMQIYNEEESTSPELAGLIPGMLNRTRTSGKYGIWGHNLGDLLLHGVEFQPDLNLWVLRIDS